MHLETQISLDWYTRKWFLGGSIYGSFDKKPQVIDILAETVLEVQNQRPSHKSKYKPQFGKSVGVSQVRKVDRYQNHAANDLCSYVMDQAPRFQLSGWEGRYLA